jgi:hypothetical protein
MSPSRQAKAAGLKNLSEVSEKTGVSLQTLTNWHRDKPKLFAVVLAGCKAINETNNRRLLDSDPEDLGAIASKAF